MKLSKKIEKIFVHAMRKARAKEIDLWTDQHEHGFQKVCTL